MDALRPAARAPRSGRAWRPRAGRRADLPPRRAPARRCPRRRGRASGKVEPKARLDCSPLTICTRRSRRSSAEALFSSAPSWASTSPGPTRQQDRVGHQPHRAALGEEGEAFDGERQEGDHGGQQGAQAEPREPAPRRHRERGRRQQPKIRAMRAEERPELASRKSVVAAWPWAAMFRAETSAHRDRLRGEAQPPQPRRATVAPRSSGHREQRGDAAGVKERGAPGGRSIASSQSLATSRAMRREGGQAVVRQLERRQREEARGCRPPRGASSIQSRASGVVHGRRRAPGATASGSASTHGKKPSAVTPRNSSVRQRHVLVGEDALARDVEHVVVDHRVPEEAAVLRSSTSQVPGHRDREQEQDRAGSGAHCATRRPRAVSQRKSATMASGPTAPRKSLASTARPRPRRRAAAATGRRPGRRG